MLVTDKKTIIKNMILETILIAVPLLLGFLLSFFLQRKNLFETVTAFFSLVYLLLFLFRISRKDNLVYRKNKYSSKEEYHQSADYKNYKDFQLLFSFAVLALVVSSVLIYFLYSI